MTSESRRLPWQGEQSEAIEFGEKEKSQGKIFLIFGPEGSGKSTQAKLLSQSTGIAYIDFGDTFREVAKEHSALGDECKRLVATRTFASFETYQEVFLHKFTKKPNEVDAYDKGMILDGAVRTDEQIGAFLELLKSSNREMPIESIYYKAPVWLLVRRLKERQRDDSKSIESILKALTNHYQGLGRRMGEVRKMAKFSIVTVGKNETPERIHKKTMKKLFEKTE